MLPPPRASLEPVPVLPEQISIWLAPGLMAPASPAAAITSTTSCPDALLNVTLGVVLLPLADWKAPSGVL